jgi:DNA polymerase-3 subunit epsilon/CBS domain-containing protein
LVDRLSATPLIALDALVVDTETTHLDPLRARLVEIAGVRLHGGKPGEPFRSLVNPGEAIPQAATRIHGIGADKVTQSPPFAAAWEAFERFRGEAIVVGHNIGYDLAVFRHECRRAGIAFAEPRSLCVRMLAELARRDLAGYSLDQLAGWLGVKIENRHSALGDARAAADVFLALIPELRERGIRTLAEAEAAIHSLQDAIEQHQRAGWSEPARQPTRAASERTLARIDSYPYRHRLRDLMTAPAQFVAPATTLGDALKVLMEKKISSVFVAPTDTARGLHRAAETGILTERDVLRAAAADGPAAFAKPVSAFASWPLAALPADAFVYRAIGRMDRLKVRHLGVVDESGFVVGALSARALLRLRAHAAVALGDEIDAASDVAELGRSWAKLSAVARGLLDEAIDARAVAAVISHELGGLTRRAGELAEARMLAAGRGAPPIPYALLVLGSAGRGESLLAMDQDNAVIFAEGAAQGPEDRWFAEFGGYVADILHEVGVPYCKGGVMAKNAQWRGSAATWRERVDDWIGRSRPEDLLSVDIFFDFRAVHGDVTLGAELWRYAWEQAGQRIDFLKLMAEAGGQAFAPAVGWFGIRTENGRADLKMGGLFGIVAAARLLAIRHGVLEHSTRARLEGIKTKMPRAERDLDALIAAHGVLLAAVLDQQLIDIAVGTPPSNRVEPRRLGRAKLKRLKDALWSLKHADQMVRDLLV